MFLKHQKVISLIEGILIILLLVSVWIAFFNSEKLQDEISENCGWGEEDYVCFCEKSESIALQNKFNGLNLGLNNVSLAG